MKMKKIIIFVLLILFSTLLVSCKDIILKKDDYFEVKNLTTTEDAVYLEFEYNKDYINFIKADLYQNDNFKESLPGAKTITFDNLDNNTRYEVKLYYEILESKREKTISQTFKTLRTSNSNNNNNDTDKEEFKV